MADLLEELSAALRDRYRIERELGHGGMGVVFLAHDLRHDRKVALKALRPDMAHSVNAERFLREIRVTAGLQHPNILPLLDSGDAGGMAFYVMPFVAGESLADRLERQRQLPVDEALRITMEVADALAYAHSRGLVHRDIKPDNILLGGGHALVADFGIAHSLIAAGDKLTQTGMALGTPAYMSPEQAMGEFDHRTDIYALACVLYEMLAGSAPFTGTYQAVMARKAAEQAPGIRVVRETVPLHVEQAVMKALSRVPADRFQSVNQFAVALAGRRGAVIEPGRLGSRRRWLVGGAAGAVLLLGGAYVLVAGAPFAGPSNISAGARYAPLTSEQGVEWFPSFSPDGQWVVYSGQHSGNRDIFLQSITGHTPINLTQNSPADDDQPAFSRDGQRIAFVSSRDGGGIFVMGRTGEAVRRVTRRGYRPTWSPDGTRIAFVTENVEMNPGNSEGLSELMIVSASGGDPVRLQAGDASQPTWSPGGRRIAYFRRLGTPAVGDIYTIDVDGGEPVALTQDAPRDWSPVWSPDGRHVYFSSDRGGSMNLWRIAIDESTGQPRGEPEPLTTPATFLGHPTIASDGQRIAYTSAQVTINVQRLGFDPDAGRVVGAPTPVTTGSRHFSSPDPSADGEWVAYYTLMQPEGHLYLSRPDGRDRRQVTSDSTVDRLPRWSPDGRWISFFSNRDGALQIWRIRPDGSGLQRVTPLRSAYHAWSPDGRRIAYVGGWRGLQDSVYVTDASGAEAPGGSIGIIGERLLVNSWSADGRYLVGQISGTKGSGRGIAIYDLEARRYEALTDFGEWPVWLPDSRRILFVANGNAFHIVDARTRVVRTIYEAGSDVVGPPRLTRDGRAMFFTRRETQADIWLLTLRR